MTRFIADKFEITKIIQQCHVIHIAWNDHPVPYLLPMNFGYQNDKDWGVFYIHTGMKGHKLELTRKNPQVGFQLGTNYILKKGEEACDWGMSFESIMGEGKLETVNDPVEKRLGLDRIMAQYDNGSSTKKWDYEKLSERTTILKLKVTKMTGIIHV